MTINYGDCLLKDNYSIINGLMAFNEGIAGETAKNLPLKRFQKKVLKRLIAFCALIPCLYLLFGTYFSTLLILFITVFIFVFIEDWSIYRKQKTKAARGAEAEKTIAQILAQLPNEYAVFHDVLVNRGNIDHIVLNNRQGIFLIETKSHRGIIKADKENKRIYRKKIPFFESKDFIAQMKEKVRCLENVLKEENHSDVRVTPIIVFTDAYVDIKYNVPIEGVYVMNKRILLRFISEHPEQYCKTAKVYFILKNKLQILSDLQITQ